MPPQGGDAGLGWMCVMLGWMANRCVCQVLQPKPRTDWASKPREVGSKCEDGGVADCLKNRKWRIRRIDQGKKGIRGS